MDYREEDFKFCYNVETLPYNLSDYDSDSIPDSSNDSDSDDVGSPPPTKQLKEKEIEKIMSAMVEPANVDPKDASVEAYFNNLEKKIRTFISYSDSDGKQFYYPWQKKKVLLTFMKKLKQCDQTLSNT